MYVHALQISYVRNCMNVYEYVYNLMHTRAVYV